ncbi:DUF3972 domain-containing protein [Nitratifractor sp.]
MEKLVKPSEYAAMVGISRQAVYAKIKKGLLPSRTVGGKIFVVVRDEPAQPPKEGEGTQDTERLLKAKDETIAVLKATINDLKETNRMITTTLRSEVELLKEAFNEMKTLYAAQIEHIRSEETLPILEVAESRETLEAPPAEAESSEEMEEEWISLEEFLEEQGVESEKLRKRILKRTRKLYKSRKEGVRKGEDDYLLTPGRAVKILTKVLEKKGK